MIQYDSNFYECLNLQISFATEYFNMGEPVSSGTNSRQHRPWELGKNYTHSSATGEGVVGSPTSLAEIFDTAFSSDVDPPSHNDGCDIGKY